MQNKIFHYLVVKSNPTINGAVQDTSKPRSDDLDLRILCKKNPPP